MAVEHVFSIPRTDSPGDRVLLHTSSNGSSPLDLQLLATEGSEPYIKTLKHSRISRYRAKSNHLSDPEWEHLLRYALFQERPETPTPKITISQDNDPLLNLELVASLASNKLTLTFRKSISGIHQRLGDLSLSHDPHAAINLFEWCHTAVSHSKSLETTLDDVNRKHAEQVLISQRLNEQLEDLIKAKKEHEDAIIRRCAVLLNTKKSKIRDQQRLLNTAKVDPKKLEEMQKLRQNFRGKGRTPEVSREGKRKASEPVSEEDDEDDAFEDAGVKVEDGEQAQEPDSEDVTPDHSDLDETEDEAEGPDSDNVSAPTTTKGKVVETLKSNGGTNEGSEMPELSPIDIPPRRELPFRKDDDGTQAVANTEKEKDTNMTDDDETDDDEL
ncbi:MAG: hypothetical protein Q9220_002970 [cf. Caloplaca sp. 1 TL-2023]